MSVLAAIAAFACFLLAAFGDRGDAARLTALGLMFLSLALVLGAVLDAPLWPWRRNPPQ